MVQQNRCKIFKTSFFSAARRKIEFLITLNSNFASTKLTTKNCIFVLLSNHERPQRRLMQQLSFSQLLRQLVPLSLAIIASLISVFTSVIILLGNFSKRKTRPNLDTKVQYASFLHDTVLSSVGSFYESSSPYCLRQFFQTVI